MRTLCFTVDLDRDVNIAIPGGIAAGSIDRGSGAGPRFSSAGKGLSILSDLLDELSIKATFFAEASTLRKMDSSLLSGHEVGMHGAEHEDLTAAGIDEKRKIMEESMAAVKDAVGKAPESFRAPYMKIDDETLGILPEFGIGVDSSRYAEMSPSLIPEKIGGIWEVPVPEGRDSLGKKISAYLWPMHESKRVPEDYLQMASDMKEGAFVIATHTWHMVESRDKGIMSKEEAEANAGNVRKVLEGMMDMGLRPSTVAEIRKMMEDRPR